MGVKIFSQFSFNGVYLLAGTGIFRNSDFPPWKENENPPIHKEL